MSFWRRLTQSDFVIKATNWEYWPFGIIQFPVMLYWLWLAVKSRSLVFFSGSNPGIVMGGMFGESKHDVLKKIPDQYIPKTLLLTLPTTTDDVLSTMREHGLTFPVIFKPDIGERGFMVKRIDNKMDIENYLRAIQINFLVQEFVDLPNEYGVFYCRFPEDSKGKITSVVMKEMLTVTGDGELSLEELILSKPRAKLQWEKLKLKFEHRLKDVIARGETIELVSIGNHCLGTKFLDGTSLINEKLSETFDDISKQIDGFYFGRFDLRAKSLDDLYNGNIKIMELNGCGAEPAHIYHPGYPLTKGIIVLWNHWSNIYTIAKQNRNRGFKFTSHSDAYQFYKKFKTVVK
jgi:hypothetical protein